jgi:hypothetical protein
MRLHLSHAKILGWATAGLSLAGLLGVAGCLSLSQRPPKLSRLTPPYRVEVYEKGRPVVERPVASGSSDELVITRWLKNHESGWRTDLNTYAPGRRIKGDNFDLNFSGRVCVLNHDPDDKGDWVQVSRTIDDSDALPPSVFAPDH